MAIMMVHIYMYRGSTPGDPSSHDPLINIPQFGDISLDGCSMRMASMKTIQNVIRLI